MEENKKKKQEERKIRAEQRKAFEDPIAKEKRKADKDRAYWLICDIVGRKEIINTVLWKEWKIWNKVASNEVIGNYLEENKEYLSSAIAQLEDVEFLRVRYLSAVLKNKLGDYKPVVAKEQIEEFKINVDVRDDVGLRTNKKKKTERRRGFAEMET